MRKRLLVLLTLAAFLLSGCSMLARFIGSEDENASLATGQKVHFKVEQGMTTTDIAKMLEAKKLVKKASAFKLEAKLAKLDSALQAGDYEITPGISNKQIIEVLNKGKVVTYNFTVPEGFSIRQIGAKLEKEGFGKARKFEELAKNYAPYDYMQTKDKNVLFKAEGFAFPSTYNFPTGVTEKELLEFMVREFDKRFTPEMRQQAAKRKISIRDIVTMASLVEEEAVFKNEQTRIAGVFYKRLDIGMRIESDTTIQYILGEQKEELTIADTKIDNPYNTYMYAGLPPGPISSPGIEAIKATLNPEKTDYLFFVAQKDGHHRFTKTFREHQRAIDEIYGAQ